MSTIKLSEIFDLSPLEDYKIHFAKYDRKTQPLDAFIRDFEEWKAWNTFSNGKDEFKRTYIFSLISFYPERDTWLFGGIWEVKKKDFSRKDNHPYTIELCEKYKSYIGRLKIGYRLTGRTVRVNMENYFGKLTVKELLDEAFSTYTFPGHKNLDIPFRTLENVITKDNIAWKTALSLKGIYLITDIKSGKRYVGKADGNGGIWKRWGDYISNGHGGDVDLKKLIDEKGLDYARENYKFTLLEIVTNDNIIDDRETYWKRVMLSRLKDFGHNKN